MSTLDLRNFVDTYVTEAGPNATGEYRAQVTVQGTGSPNRNFPHLWIGLQDILGRTVLSATLFGTALDAIPAATWTVWRISTGPIDFGQLTWNTKPASVAGSGQAKGAVAIGAELALDVTADVASIAAGGHNYGWVITNNLSAPYRFNSTESGNQAWRLEVVLSDEPATPDGLAPNGGSVSSGEPILSWTAFDLGGTTGQAQFQVQIDPDADEVTPAYDSGWVVSVDPMYDLAPTSFTPVAALASTQWRVRTKSAAGVESDWSDWAAFTHTPKPTLTITQPAGAVIYDPTPPFEGNIGAATLASVQLMVVDGVDTSRILWDTGRFGATGSSFADIVDEFYRNTRVLFDDRPYRFVARVWDNVDRASGVIADPTYIEATRDVTFDDDVAVTAPAAYAITTDEPGSPILEHTWTRGTDPDYFSVWRDGVLVKLVMPADWSKVGTTYTWVDNGITAGWTTHDYQVRAHVAKRESVPATVNDYTAQVRGVWLIRKNGDRVCLRGEGIDGFRTSDKVATYDPINGNNEIDVHYGPGSIRGSYEGEIQDERDGTTIEAQRAVLREIDLKPTEALRMVWATESRWVTLRHLTHLPTSKFYAGRREHFVAFEFTEALEGQA